MSDVTPKTNYTTCDDSHKSHTILSTTPPVNDGNRSQNSINQGNERGKGKSRPKTLKRRLQNRKAQRRYRKKQARKIANLKNLATGAAGAAVDKSTAAPSRDQDGIEPVMQSQYSTGGSDHFDASSPSNKRGRTLDRSVKEPQDSEAQFKNLEGTSVSDEQTLDGGLDLEFSRYFVPEITRVFGGEVEISRGNEWRVAQRPSVDQESSISYLSNSDGAFDQSRSFPLTDVKKNKLSPESIEQVNSNGSREESMDAGQPNLESDPSRPNENDALHSMTTSSDSTALGLLPPANTDRRLDHQNLAVHVDNYGTINQRRSELEPSRYRLQLHDASEDVECNSLRTGRNHERQNTIASSYYPINNHSPPQDSALPLHLQLPSYPALRFPYPDNLRLTRIATHNAYLSNALVLGFHIPSLFLLAYQSPFYRPRPHPMYPRPGVPSSTPGDGEDLRTSTAQLNAHIPEHLRPTPPQVLCPHHAYLDLLPFPILRARAVALAARKPPLIDVKMLKRDLMDGGLICWGTTASDTGAGGRQPCDVRSWEAAPWFLRRWAILVGGKDGEVWKQTLWWRGFRGEKEEIV